MSVETDLYKGSRGGMWLFQLMAWEAEGQIRCSKTSGRLTIVEHSPVRGLDLSQHDERRDVRVLEGVSCL